MIDFSAREKPFTPGELVYVDLYRAGGMPLLLMGYYSLEATLDRRDRDDFLRVYAWFTLQEQAEAAAAQTFPPRRDADTVPKSLPDNDLRHAEPANS